MDQAPHSDVEQDDALISRREHPIRLPVFEGPLDLLLYLIRKNEIDIHDIPIGTVTKQYLEVLRSYDRMNLDVAGEFFVMAATLMYIKSRMLLPPEKVAAEETSDSEATDDEENLDPRWQLVRQLIQYKRIKESAGYLHELIESRQGYAQRIVKPPAEDSIDRPVAAADRVEIWNTFNTILRRLVEQATPGEIQVETVTITTRMEDILARLVREPKFSFTALLPEKPGVALLVATFLACLELARLGKIILGQNASFDDILCEARPPDDPLFAAADGPIRSEFEHAPEDAVEVSEDNPVEADDPEEDDSEEEFDDDDCDDADDDDDFDRDKFLPEPVPE